MIAMLWQLLEQLLPALPSFIARFSVGFANGGIGWFTGTHETVASAFVDHRFVFFPSGFHQFFGLRDGRVHALIVLAIKTVNRTCDVFHFVCRVGRLAVK